jgi:AcrR family transcriptional regulator
LREPGYVMRGRAGTPGIRYYCRTAMAESVSTRDLLLDAATRLFAERGVDNVSIAEIVRAANQRNTSAIHYHFGNRDEVLRAVLARHVPELAHRRSVLLEQAQARPARDIRSAADAIVRPITEFAQGGWRQRAYLQIGSELAGSIDRVSPDIRALLTQTAGHEAWDLLRTRCPRIPIHLWRVRQDLCIVFVGRAAADRARQLDLGGKKRVLSDDRFVDNLVEMVLGAMRAPHRNS